MGMAVLLAAVLSAVGTAIDLGTGLDPDELEQSAETIGIVGGTAVLVVLFVGYFAGKYVAGRMARFDGTKQGLAVWLSAIIVAILVAVVAAVGGSQYNVLEQVNGFPRVPISEGNLTTGGIVAAVAAVIVSLAGALLGGRTGMRYHRKIDDVGLVR